MKFFALLPMKENSERVPKKNYKLMSGTPLFYYIADSINKTGLFEKLVINTDSNIIMEMANKRYGEWVIIHERTNELCGDLVSMNKIIDYDINMLGKENHYMQTHSTNPFLKSKVLIEAISEYKTKVIDGICDSIFSVNALKTRLYDFSLKPINHSPNELVRTQDLETIYEENSNFYIFSYNSFIKNDSRIGDTPLPYVMDSDRIESLDIDDLEDWDFAEDLINNGRINIS